MWDDSNRVWIWHKKKYKTEMHKVKVAKTLLYESEAWITTQKYKIKYNHQKWHCYTMSNGNQH